MKIKSPKKVKLSNKKVFYAKMHKFNIKIRATNDLRPKYCERQRTRNSATKKSGFFFGKRQKYSYIDFVS